MVSPCQLRLVEIARQGTGRAHRWNSTLSWSSGGVRILAGMRVLRDKVTKPVLAGLGRPRLGRSPQGIQPLDQHYSKLRRELGRTFETLGLAA